ncbi:MAG TPA: hypothetical protein VGH87_07845 [Polyangiaceae bacterium]
MRFAFALVLVACGSAPENEPDAGDAAVEASPVDAQQEADAIDAPDIDTIAWSTGASIGFGVAFKDTQNPLGNGLFIGYGGYGAKLFESELWVTALYRATLRTRGVRWVWAVQGPSDPDYTQNEIGNSKIAGAMIPLVNGTPLVAIAAHSSGAFVAQELLEQLATGGDPTDVTKNLVVYFALDGGGGTTPAAIDRTKNAWWVSSHDGTTQSANYAAMTSLASTYASKGGFYDNDASGSGCDPGADWCVHDTLINTRPHDPTNLDVPDDYSDFAGRPVCTSYLDAKL